MPSILIVGGGQAGLQLAIGLVDDGHEVTVMSNRTPAQLASGRVMSSQCMFDASLQHERDLGIAFWEHECPPVEGVALTVPGPEGGKLIDWSARLERPAQSVDQRLKMPRFMEELERRGGKVVLADVTLPDLETYASRHDLVIVAAGKGDVAQLFERDAARSPHDAPQRALALTYVTGLEPRPAFSAVSFNLIPTVGEYFVFPALTASGPCEIMVFEGIPGGPMDCWSDVTTPEEHLARSKWVLDTFLPWEAARAGNVELTDANGVLAGRFSPTVRRPVGELPSGAVVLGLADAVVLNDPITGQGSNNASKAAASYLASIRARPEGPFDRQWMQETFDRYWQYAQYVTTWTNAMLGPPPPHVLELLMAGNDHQLVADRFANGFDNPPDFFDWFMEPEKASRFLAEAAS
jgi:2-polyprenyl-6-methoxyphenol hydroxylase-like FAD-dependent oxidoreductase